MSRQKYSALWNKKQVPRGPGTSTQIRKGSRKEWRENASKKEFTVGVWKEWTSDHPKKAENLIGYLTKQSGLFIFQPPSMTFQFIPLFH